MPRFQFTIQALLWATLWIAVTASAWRFAMSWFEFNGPDLSLAAIAVFLGLLSLAAAAGRIIGPPRKWIQVAIIAISASISLGLTWFVNQLE